MSETLDEESSFIKILLEGLLLIVFKISSIRLLIKINLTSLSSLIINSFLVIRL